MTANQRDQQEATREALELAIKNAGSEAKLSKKISSGNFSFSQPAINKAKKTGRVSGEMAKAIDEANLGVSKSTLRPDMWPAVDEPARADAQAGAQ
jgi:hypothetical protein